MFFFLFIYLLRAVSWFKFNRIKKLFLYIKWLIRIFFRLFFYLIFYIFRFFRIFLFFFIFLLVLFLIFLAGGIRVYRVKFDKKTTTVAGFFIIIRAFIKRTAYNFFNSFTNELFSTDTLFLISIFRFLA